MENLKTLNTNSTMAISLLNINLGFYSNIPSSAILETNANNIALNVLQLLKYTYPTYPRSYKFDNI